MSTENIAKFSEAAVANTELQAKIQTIHTDATRAAAGEIAALSVQAGTPFTAEEFLAHAAPVATELSDEQLESVAGGVWDPSFGNIAMSVLTAGVLCAVVAGVSAAIHGDSDHKKCQSKSNPNE